MEITKEQIKELVKIAQAIDNENRIDDDVTGGYVEEPYNSIIERIYAVVKWQVTVWRYDSFALPNSTKVRA